MTKGTEVSEVTVDGCDVTVPVFFVYSLCHNIVVLLTDMQLPLLSIFNSLALEKKWPNWPDSHLSKFVQAACSLEHQYFP